MKLPSWRLDLEREIDLVEEVARVYGYNRFANTLPTALPVVAHPLAAAESAVRTRLLALGYSEAISSSFASEADGASVRGDASAEWLRWRIRCRTRRGCCGLRWRPGWSRCWRTT